MKTKTPSLSRPVTELAYGPTGLSDGVHGELYAAPAYGDLAHGPHGLRKEVMVGQPGVCSGPTDGAIHRPPEEGGEVV